MLVSGRLQCNYMILILQEVLDDGGYIRPDTIVHVWKYGTPPWTTTKTSSSSTTAVSGTRGSSTRLSNTRGSSTSSVIQSMRRKLFGQRAEEQHEAAQAARDGVTPGVTSATTGDTGASIGSSWPWWQDELKAVLKAGYKAVLSSPW